MNELYRKRYHAMLYVFGLSVVLSLLWGLCRWGWLLSGMSWGAGGAYVMPVFLTGLQLYLCRHYIRAIDDSIEKYVWCSLPFLSLLLFYSVGQYVEMRFFPHNGDANAGKMMAQVWQLVLLAEAFLLFLVYRKYYVVCEYEASVKESASKDIISSRKLSGLLVFLVVPLAMVCLYVIASNSDGFDEHTGIVLARYGSLQYILVLERGEWWRLFTYTFLHANVIHLLSNLICYYICALSIYNRHNGYLVFAIFMLSSLVSGLTSNSNC